MSDIDWLEPPSPPWADEETDPDLTGDDVEIDLTGDEPVVRRKQNPEIDHPWAENWPSWPSL